MFSFGWDDKEVDAGSICYVYDILAYHHDQSSHYLNPSSKTKEIDLKKRFYFKHDTFCCLLRAILFLVASLVKPSAFSIQPYCLSHRSLIADFCAFLFFLEERWTYPIDFEMRAVAYLYMFLELSCLLLLYRFPLAFITFVSTHGFEILNLKLTNLHKLFQVLWK